LKKVLSIFIFIFIFATNLLWSGEAYFLKPDGTRTYHIKDLQLDDGNRGYTGRVGTVVQINSDLKLELGKRTVILRKDEGDRVVVVLIKGRLRVKSKSSSIHVRTPSASILVGKGFSDIIIANLNTLAVSREGDDLRVSTSKKIQHVPVGKYILITTEGDISINEFKTDKEGEKE
jgi:hypothetical protein